MAPKSPKSKQREGSSRFDIKERHYEIRDMGGIKALLTPSRVDMILNKELKTGSLYARLKLIERNKKVRSGFTSLKKKCDSRKAVFSDGNKNIVERLIKATFKDCGVHFNSTRQLKYGQYDKSAAFKVDVSVTIGRTIKEIGTRFVIDVGHLKHDEELRVHFYQE